MCVYISQMFSLIFNPRPSVLMKVQWSFKEKESSLLCAQGLSFFFSCVLKISFQRISSVVLSVFAVSLHHEILNLHHITHFMNTQ